MSPEKALELASQYGILNVVLILILFFFAGFILYVMRLQERRENKLFDFMEKDFKGHEQKETERHMVITAALTLITEADKRQRDEHDVMLRNQKEGHEQHQRITSLLDSLIGKVSLLNGNK